MIRIGTWNLDHAAPEKRDVERIGLIDSAECDVLILTETHDRIHPTDSSYKQVHSQQRPYFPPNERWTSIWTRLTILDEIVTDDPLRTVAVLLLAGKERLLVYGTVLPWHSDIGDAIDFRDARPETIRKHPRHWHEHSRVVSQQTSEWERLQLMHSDASLVIAGDWNTDLLAGTKVARYPYGPTSQVEQITRCVSHLGLQIPTRKFADPSKHRDWLIDHIAVPKGDTQVSAEPSVDDGKWTLSDHPLVCVDWQS